MEGATDVQLETLIYINEFYKEHGYPASIQEIANANNVAANAIQGRVGHLADKGYVTKKRFVARSIVVTSAGREEIERLQ